MTEGSAEEDQSKVNLNWSPEAPAGLNFTSVLPDNFGSGYQALPSENEQTELKTKLRSSRLTSRRHSKVDFYFLEYFIKLHKLNTVLMILNRDGSYVITN